MGKGRVTALLLAVVVIGLALMRTATASHTTDHKAFSGGAEFKGLVVKTKTTGSSVTSVFPNWQTVDSRGFQIPAGESQLIVVDFFAETLCTGSSASCLARVLVGRTLAGAEVLPPGDGALDSVGDDTFESHSISRALCVRNATASPLNVSVWLEATKLTDNVTDFSLSRWTFKIARNAPCSPFVDI